MLNVSSSNSQEAKVPELRFPEFSDNWETVALSDFTERVTRKNVNNESNLPLTISSKDGLVDQISYFNKAVASRNMSGYYLLQNGEFAYNKSYSVGYDFGSIKRLDKYPKGALSTLYICFALKKYDSDFIKIYFDSLKWYREIRMIAAEGARNHGLLNVSADAFFATKHILPQNEKEQEKIAAFMVLLGKKVVLQQQLVDALKLYKRGALSRLFPKNGASVPEYHFSGFTDDWEQRKFSDFTRTAGKRNKDDLDLEPYAITNEHGFIPQRDAHDEFGYMKDTDRKAYNIVEPYSFAYNPARINVGSIGYYEGAERVIVSSLYEVFKTADYVDDRFLWHWFKSDQFPKWITKLQEGSVRQYFYYDKLCECQMLMPVIEEQKEIASLLDRLDTIITLHQRKLDEYKSIKKGLLEKLFI